MPQEPAGWAVVRSVGPGQPAQPPGAGGPQRPLPGEQGRVDGWNGLPPRPGACRAYLRGHAYGAGVRARYLAVRLTKLRRPDTP